MNLEDKKIDQVLDAETNQIPVRLPVVLPALAMRGLVVFPGMLIHFDVARKKSIAALDAAVKGNRKIFLVMQKDFEVEDPKIDDLHTIGVVAEVRQVLKVADDNRRVLVEGIYRATLQDMLQDTDLLMAMVCEATLKPINRKPEYMQAMVRTLKHDLERYCELAPKVPKEMMINFIAQNDPIELVEYAAGNLMLPPEAKQQILEQSNPVIRLRLLIQVLRQESEILALEQEIESKVHDQMEANQREYYLREQMKAITQELGEGEDPLEEAAEYRLRIGMLSLPKTSEEKLLAEVDKLAKMPFGSHEGSVLRAYLDLVLSLPFNTASKEKNQVTAAEKVLDQDHYGMQKVKDRILEFVAVRQLAPDLKGQILCLEGPPGVGKTSIAKSLAKAMGRKFVRISLGGVRDEAEIRGHRKTYIGAMPGRIIEGIRQAGVNNPLILLDEIDKMSNDFRGDPSSAMLEVLDPEQNSHFSDHYVEIPFDLSHCVFITTANDPSAIPGPLKDRMEMISLPSYTRLEKLEIATRHLLPKQRKLHGLTAGKCKITPEALQHLIDFYSREAGVRQLERLIASVCRKVAKKIATDEVTRMTVTPAHLEELLGPKKYRAEGLAEQDPVGVVNGLAWTSVGGELLEIEALSLPGDGKVQLTGSLGDVMQESARIAISYLRSIAPQYGIPADFYKTTDLHIHAPEGAVPKDGPSAGVTMVTALVSRLANLPVHRDVAMTGEISLTGRVLAIGGLREKAMAAHRKGIRKVLIPADNLPDLAEVDEQVKAEITFVPVSHIETVLEHALVLPDIQASKQSDVLEQSVPPVLQPSGKPAPTAPVC